MYSQCERNAETLEDLELMQPMLPSRIDLTGQNHPFSGQVGITVTVNLGECRNGLTDLLNRLVLNSLVKPIRGSSVIC